MITIEETRKAIEKYQKEHPLHCGAIIDVTNFSSKEGVDIVSQVIEKISKKVDEDTDLWCICEMAKMYIQGVTPVYHVKQEGKCEFIEILARYIPDDVCPYPEYRGKPYYSIHYKENGEEFVGFSSYNLEVLSSYLKEYFFKQKDNTNDMRGEEE